MDSDKDARAQGRLSGERFSREGSSPRVPNKEVTVLGVKLNLVSRKEVLERVDAFLSSSVDFKEAGFVMDSSALGAKPTNAVTAANAAMAARPSRTPRFETKIISTTNSEFIMAAQKDADFRDIINNSFLSVPDGIGTLFAHYYLRNLKRGNRVGDFFRGIKLGFDALLEPSMLGERVSGVELSYALCELAVSRGYNVFLLGGWPKDFFGRPLESPSYDLAQKAASNLKNQFPGLKVIGATSGFSHLPKDDVSTLNYIHSQMKKASVRKIDILLVCYGQSNQEKWIQRNAGKIPARVALGVGGSFDYIAGIKKRAPSYIRDIHMEWLYRLVTQPWRIKRIFGSFPAFPLKVFLQG